MFDLSDIIDRIEYSIDGKEKICYLEDQQDIYGTKLFVYLLPSLKLLDYIVTIDDEEISIEEIDATLRYEVIFNFSKLDVATGECEYTYDVRFDYVDIEAMSNREDLELLVEHQIEEEVRVDKHFKISELTFKPILKKLQ